MVLWFRLVFGLMGCSNGPMDVYTTSDLYTQTAIYGCILYLYCSDSSLCNQGMFESSQPFPSPTFVTLRMKYKSPTPSVPAFRLIGNLAC